MSSSPFENLQAKRREIYRRVAEMPFGRQVLRPRPDGWSPLEVLEHLNLHDQWIAGSPSIRKGVPSNSPFLWIGRRLVDSGVSFPTVSFLEPKGGLTLPQLAEVSDARHTGIATLVANAHPGETMVQGFPFGPLSADQLCTVLDAHYGYHLKRI